MIPAVGDTDTAIKDKQSRNQEIRQIKKFRSDGGT